MRLPAGPVRANQAFPLTFVIRGAPGGEPLADLHPGAWIRPRLPGRSRCEDAVKGYLVLGPNNGQDISLNGYTFVTFNSDNTLAVVDPQLNLATANLRALLRLQSRAGDWQLDQVSGRLYITLPQRRSLVVVDAFAGVVRAAIDTPPDPAQLLLTDEGRVLWLASDSAGVVQRIDVATSSVTATHEIGQGAVRLVEDEEDGWLFAYAEGDGTLVVLDSASGKVARHLSLPPGLRQMRYSAPAQRLVLLDREALVLVSPHGKGEPDRRPLGAAATALQLSPDGRWALAADGEAGHLVLFDLSRGTPTHRLAFRHPFDQIVFSDHYAYLRHTGVPRVSLVHMASLVAGLEPGVIDIPLGSKPPQEVSVHTSLPAIDPLPEGGGAIVVSPADRMLFLYIEDGMRAPMNAFRTWTAPPLAVMIHDRSLNERAPGHYSTVTLIPQPGEYEVVFYLPNPPMARCLPLTVAGEQAMRAASPQRHFRMQLDTNTLVAGTSASVALSLIDEQGRQATPDDLEVLIFRPGRNWQQRAFPSVDEDGRYRVRVNFPEPGRYRIGAASTQLGLRFESRTLRTLEVSP